MSEEQIQMGVVWSDVENQQVLNVNQFATQLSPGPDGRPEQLLLAVGNIAPPLILGDAEQVHALLSAIGTVEVKALGRFALTRGRLDELIAVLVNAANQWDQQVQEGGQV